MSPQGKVRDHLVVIHRWSDSYADYGSYVDHGTHNVSYVTTSRAARSLPERAAAVRTVGSTEDGKAVRAAVSSLVEEFGKPVRIVALHEVDLDMAADLRAKFGVPGQRSDELAPFRDKLVMAGRLAAAGIPVPPTRPAADRAAVRAFAADHGWPVLIKPVRGTASQGVVRFASEEDLDRHEFQDVPMLVQPYVPHDILHVDGVATEEGLAVSRISRYLHTCLEFTEGLALGSVEVDDPQLTAQVGKFTAEVVRALSPGPLVFHVELFASGTGAAPQLQVLEVGARPGGAEVPLVWKEVHGIDLMAVAFAMQTGASLPTAMYTVAGQEQAEFGGWLLVPWPASRPCRVIGANSQLGRRSGPYTERIPVAGETLADIPGYEHAGARFRFRGRRTADVEAAVSSTIEDFDLRCRPLDMSAPGRVVLVGSGGRPYREYAFAAAAAQCETFLVTPAEPTWQLGYLGGYRVAPGTDVDALTRAVAECVAGARGRAGVLTWDEVLLEATSEVASRLGLPHISPAAAHNCRDKLSTRRLLHKAGLSPVRFAHVRGRAQALREASAIGYPVVLKPRSLAGSVGVVIAQNADELVALYQHASDAAYPGLDPLEGLMLEEFLEGPEISVDSVVCEQDVRLVNVARKRLGFAPFFEEVGHLVSPWRHEPWADDVVALVVTAHHALGVDSGVTHAEVRLTPAGPRLVELNGRLGGDFIPYLGYLATGVDLTAAAVELALGNRPSLQASRDACAEVRFLYPSEDSLVCSLDVSAVAAVPGVVEVVPLANPGSRLLLPPRGVVPRLAGIIVKGGTPEECGDALDRASALVRYRTEPLRTVAEAP